jgi:hypothetical protein
MNTATRPVDLTRTLTHLTHLVAQVARDQAELRQVVERRQTPLSVAAPGSPPLDGLTLDEAATAAGWTAESAHAAWRRVRAARARGDEDGYRAYERARRQRARRQAQDTQDGAA